MSLSIVQNIPERSVLNVSSKDSSNPQINFRATTDNNLERVPQQDSFATTREKKNNGLKAALGIAGTAVLALGIICYSKGKAADDVEKSFGKRMKDGWNELWGIAKKNADKPNGSSDDAVKAAEKAKKEAEEKAKKEAEEKARLEAEKGAEDYLKSLEEAPNKKNQELAESNKRNQEWLNKQHEIKEKEYSDFWKNAFNERKEADISKLNKWLEVEKDNIIADFKQYDKIWKDPVAEFWNSLGKAEEKGFKSLQGKKGSISADGRTITQQSKNMKWVYKADDSGNTLSKLELYRDGELLGTIEHAPRGESDYFASVLLPENNARLEFEGCNLFQYQACFEDVYGNCKNNKITSIFKNHNDLEISVKGPGYGDSVNTRTYLRNVFDKW